LCAARPAFSALEARRTGRCCAGSTLAGRRDESPLSSTPRRRFAGSKRAQFMPRRGLRQGEPGNLVPQRLCRLSTLPLSAKARAELVALRVSHRSERCYKSFVRLSAETGCVPLRISKTRCTVGASIPEEKLTRNDGRDSSPRVSNDSEYPESGPYFSFGPCRRHNANQP